MTTEIAIMNKSAIALAADSAVTFSKPDGQLKIYNTVNKLFALSKHEPIGIMIFDNAELMGVPWETIIKIYRARLGSKKFLALEDYAKDFLTFLSDNTKLFPQSVQLEYFREIIRGFFSQIIRATMSACDALIKSSGSIDDPTVLATLEHQIRLHCDDIAGRKDIDCLPESFLTMLAKDYTDTIEAQINNDFQKFSLPQPSKTLLQKTALLTLTKDWFPESGNSGVVIAGFGDSEPFPSLRSYIVQGVAGNKLKFATYRTASITFSNSATITPFAQEEMVHTFMRGVNPSYEDFVLSTMNDIVKRHYFDPIERSTQISEEDRKDLVQNLRDIQAAAIKELREKLTRYKRDNHIGPVIDAVAALPKDELAAMAESLVSLTILKRRVSMTAETVGGAIDVVLISKGDGLIWVKRKHYFKRDLNPQFLANYYRNDEEEIS